MIGEVYDYRVRYAMDMWQDEKRLADGAELKIAFANINYALYWHPNRPDYLEHKAHLYLYFMLIYAHRENIFRWAGLKAVELHQRALRLRPTWPYSWAGLALIKAYLGEFDKDYIVAYNNAIRYGKLEVSVQKELIEAGLIARHKRFEEPALQSSFLSVLRTAIATKSYPISEIKSSMYRYHQLEDICTLLNNNLEEKKRLC